MDHNQKALFLFLVLVAIFLQAHYFGFMLDDPYISFRYAHNLINGHGLEFNVGERVEGYTNFLWTILLAGLMGLGGDPVLASKVLGMALSCGTLILVFLLHRKVMGESDNRFRPLLSVGLVATSCYFNLWTVGGLETPLYTVLLLAALWSFLHERDHRQFPVCGFVCCMQS
jgi:arabinofuranosyltransferase